MRRSSFAAVAATLVVSLSGCWRLTSGADSWTAVTQRRLTDLVVAASPFPAVAWPTDSDSPYERAMAQVALHAVDPGSDLTVDAAGTAFAGSWNDAVGGFTQEGIPPLYVSEVVWRALTHDGARPLPDPAHASRLTDLAAGALAHTTDHADLWEAATALRLLSDIAAHRGDRAIRARASAAILSFDTHSACSVPRRTTQEAALSDGAALLEITRHTHQACHSYPVTRSSTDRELRAALAARTPGGGADPDALSSVADGWLLAGSGLVSTELLERGTDAMLALAADDGLEPDPRYALDLVDLAERSGREVSFGPRMMQMLRATAWAGGTIPDQVPPDAESLLVLADALALLPGGPARADLSGRVDWDSAALHPSDRLLVSLAVDPARVVAADLDHLAGTRTDLAAAPVAWRASSAMGGCPSQARAFTRRALALILSIDPERLVQHAPPPRLRDLATILDLAALCDLGGEAGRSAPTRLAIENRLDNLRTGGALYGISAGGPADVEVTAVAIETLCHLGDDPAARPSALRSLVEEHQSHAGGEETPAGRVGLNATLAAAQLLAFAYRGCAAVLHP